MFGKKVILIFINLLLAGYSICDEMPLIVNQNSYDQAVQNAKQRINLDKIRQNQAETNRDNALAAKLYNITGIPSWKNMEFIYSAKVNNQINPVLLVQSINNYLIDYRHPQLSNSQIKSINQIVNHTLTP